MRGRAKAGALEGLKERVGIRLALILGIALIGAVSMTTAVGATTPQTAFQCQSRYGPGSKRAHCLAQVKSEKPGSSCSHPLRTETSGLEQKGARKDFTVEVLGKNPEAPSGAPWHVQVSVKVLNPRIVMCPHVELKTWVWTLEEEERGIPLPGKLRTFFPAIDPHGGFSEPLTVPWGSYVAIATARWAHSSTHAT
jgi:hypothetical protein